MNNERTRHIMVVLESWWCSSHAGARVMLVLEIFGPRVRGLGGSAIRALVGHAVWVATRLGYATNGAKLALDAWVAARAPIRGAVWPADGRGRPLVNGRMPIKPS
jgi:hypothetical protein